MNNLFFDFALVIVAATIGCYLFRLLRQPLIPAYILVGFLLGPSGAIFIKSLGLPVIGNFLQYISIQDPNAIKLASEIGIAFLLFFVGLEIDFKKLKYVSSISTIGGAFQVIITFLVGYFAALGLGLVANEATYLGLVLAFSSTVIVIKLLSDKKELDTLHGRIVIGILLMQDAIAILALSYLTSLNVFTPSVIVFSLVKAVLLVAVAFLCAKLIFPFLFKFAAKSIEVLFLLSLSVMFLFSLLATHLGFSIIVGAFISGVALGSLEYNIEIISRIRSLKDFFVTIFFVSLGMEIIFTDLTKVWTVLVVFLALAMIAKPLIIQILSALFGYTKSTGFLTAISLGQVSEFSLVIVSLGLVLGHITPEFFSLTIVLAVITMIFTSYFIKYDNKIMRFMSKPLSIFDAISPTKTGFEYLPEKVKKPDVVLLGCDRVGYKIFEQLTKLKKNIIVVDFNPEIIKELASKRIHCIYGDVGDMDIIERIDLKNAKMIISTVPDVNDNILLVKETRKVNKKGTVITTSFDADDALRLYKEGADYVILPHYLGGEHFSALLEEFEDAESVLKRKLCHIEELKTRRFIHKKPLNGK